MVLEFLGLKREATYCEKDLESALITHLQDFLLELGNGFSFVARQKRIHVDGDEFFVDLVFYNRLFQSFVLFDLLCCVQHKRSYVAQVVMWCRPPFKARMAGLYRLNNT